MIIIDKNKEKLSAKLKKKCNPIFTNWKRKQRKNYKKLKNMANFFFFLQNLKNKRKVNKKITLDFKYHENDSKSAKEKNEN